MSEAFRNICLHHQALYETFICYFVYLFIYLFIFLHLFIKSSQERYFGIWFYYSH